MIDENLKTIIISALIILLVVGAYGYTQWDKVCRWGFRETDNNPTTECKSGSQHEYVPNEKAKYGMCVSRACVEQFGCPSGFISEEIKGGEYKCPIGTHIRHARDRDGKHWCVASQCAPGSGD